MLRVLSICLITTADLLELEEEERAFDLADALEVDDDWRGEGMRPFERGAGGGADMDAARLAIGFEPGGEVDGVAQTS